jgi:hypothetical protein
LDAAKHGDLYYTRVLILKNRFLVYAFDEVIKIDFREEGTHFIGLANPVTFKLAPF